MAITDHGDLYTWGWKECVPSGKASGNQISGGTFETDALETQASPKKNSEVVANFGNNIDEEGTKRRRVSSSSKQALESSTSSGDTLSAQPYLVTLATGVKVTAVASGGRHALALSDTGQVWGWGYGGQGQLGLGSRIRMVPSPHLVPCVESLLSNKDSQLSPNGNLNSNQRTSINAGSRVNAIACGGRHSAIITDTGTLLSFGWGLYGQVSRYKGLQQVYGIPFALQLKVMSMHLVEISMGN